MTENESIRIRRATACDVKDVKALEMEAGLGGWTEDDYLLETDRPESLFLIAKIGMRTAGFIVARLIMNLTHRPPNSIKLLSTPEKPANEIEIYNIAVKNTLRGESIGTRLLNEIIREGKENDVGDLHLEVRKSNETARNFYKKNGFTVIGERKNFYTNPSEDAVLMHFKIVH